MHGAPRTGRVVAALAGLLLGCGDSAPPASPQSPAVIRLVFAVQPGESYAGATLAPSITVVAMSATDTAFAFDGDVQVALADSTSRLEGGATVKATAGVARFSTLKVSPAGRYTLIATAGNVTARSLPFDILATPRLAYTTCTQWVVVDERICTVSGIRVLSPDGPDRLLSTRAGSQSWDPAWAPNGRHIAVVGSRDCSGFGQCTQDLYVIDASDGSERRLTHGEFYTIAHPAWSPDGNRIVFSFPTDNVFKNSGRIYTVNSDGSGIAPVGDLRGESPVWSPDGSRFAFAALTANRRYSIFVAGADGSNVVQITAGDRTDDNPVWSPDGRTILFTRSGTGTSGRTECQLWSISLSAGTPTQLTHDPFCVRAPAWSPDGQRVAYISDVSFDTSNLMVMAADGSGAKLLRRLSGGESRPTWAPTDR